MTLVSLRQRIDSLDEKIVGLLNQRVKISADIAREKRQSGQSVYSPDREQAVLAKVTRRASDGPLKKSALEAIYREIMSSSLAAQRPLKVAYLGPEATFTHLAAMKRFGSQVNFIPSASISDVFLEVERGQADYGVIPVENSIEGAVTHTLDMLIDSDLKICAQVILNVSHNLLARCKIASIKRVYSNPQVFGQCRLWLRENLVWAEKIEVSSTTRAAQIAAKEKSSGAIASALAAKVYKLKLLAGDIEDSPHNATRFLVVGIRQALETGRDKTSLVFSIKDKVGALHDMLIPFMKYKINLTKIESRPSKKKAWDYFFFVDLIGHSDNPRVAKALSELEQKCRFLKVLGSYPVGE